jgi:MarR family transcriptional regulator for hemolysin
MGPSEEPIGLFVNRAARVVSRAFDTALARRGASVPSWLVLSSLKGGAHGSQRELAATLGIEGPTLTHHLNRMESAGLVTRTRDPRNRRVHQVALTEAGEREFRTVLDEVLAFDRQLRAGLTTDELATLRRLLQRVADNAAAFGAEPTAGDPDTGTPDVHEEETR